MIFRVRFEVAGGHVHCALFAAQALNMTFAKCGDFTVRKGLEFRELVIAFGGAQFLGCRDEDTMCLAGSPYEDLGVLEMWGTECVMREVRFQS